MLLIRGNSQNPSTLVVGVCQCDDIANHTASKVGSKKGRKDMASKNISGNAGELHMRIVLCLGEFQIDSVSHRPEMKLGCQRPKELMVQ